MLKNAQVLADIDDEELAPVRKSSPSYRLNSERRSSKSAIPVTNYLSSPKAKSVFPAMCPVPAKKLSPS